jgi:hypothetical protein
VLAPWHPGELSDSTCPASLVGQVRMAGELHLISRVHLECPIYRLREQLQRIRARNFFTIGQLLTLAGRQSEKEWPGPRILPLTTCRRASGSASARIGG